jgi:hypothetical protein
MGMLSVVKREALHTGVVALHLLFCFGIFATLKKLFLATYQIEFSALLPTVIGALALAKVVVVLDMTSLATRLETDNPIWVATLYKTLFYCGVSAPVLFAERAWHAYRETGALGQAVLEGVDTNRSKRRVGQSHCRRPRLCLLPPLPGNRSPFGTGRTSAHDLQPRMRAAMAPQCCGRPTVGAWLREWGYVYLVTGKPSSDLRRPQIGNYKGGLYLMSAFP